nr:hypothetical protein [Yersinia mollaretii]
MGIGLPSITAIANFDWQNFVFTLGANYLASSTNWLNVPAGVSYATGLPISITVDYITNDANNIGLTLIPNTVNNASFIVYKVSVFGAVGSRAFAVRDIPTSANPVPTSGRLLNTQVFASNGTYNPTAGTAYIEVEAVGAGGASGSLSATGAGQGAVSVPGSNGAYALASFTTGFSGGINVAVGVGGQGIFGNGPKGGDTTFGALLTCPGGPGSSVSLALNPPSYSSPPSGPAIPTVSGGGKLIKLTYGNRLNPAAMLAVGVFTNYRATDLTPFGLFGVGADGQIGNSSSVAIIGASGNSGYLIVREYS